MVSRKGCCMPLISWHKKGVFRFARFAKIGRECVIGILLPEYDF
jgi:hypothetical protein